MSKVFFDGKPVDYVWQENTNIIKSFLEIRPNYEKLSEEVAYILKKHISKAKIEFSDVTYRAKSLNSFCEKILHKSIKNPLKEITDLSGVRIVYLYLSDCPKIEALIENEFKVIEKANKVKEQEPDRFGYGALHFLVKLGKEASGARYDDLKDLVCEIQVRTILQDAWAIVGHHLSYKQESDVPLALIRKLNALSGLFETADDQFDKLRDERIKYIGYVKKDLRDKVESFLDQGINLDNLTEYLRWRLADRQHSNESEISDLLSELQKLDYINLKQLDDIILKSYTAIKEYEKQYPPHGSESEATVFVDVGVVRSALCFTDVDYLKMRKATKTERERLDKFRGLVKN